MATITYRDGIAILQLVVFPVFIIAAFLIWKRTGWRAGRKTWRFVISLSLLRIIGGICTLLTITNQNETIYIAEAVCELIGIAPLILTYIGLLGQIDIQQRMHPKYLTVVSITCFIGLILGIAGISMTSDHATTFHANAIVKAAMAIFIVVFVVLLSTTVWLYLQLGSKSRVWQQKLFCAIALSSPFLLVRLVYSAVGDFTDDSRFGILKGNATIYLCMSVLQEIAAISICVVFGMIAVPEKECKEVAYDETGAGLINGRV